MRVFAVSVILLIPCYWHPRIEAGDLGSHTYNAWLAQLIERGDIRGLHVVWMWHNAFFDLLLSGFAKSVSIQVAEKLAVSASMLVFFWGIFAFIAALNGRAPWTLVPCLAMFAYGWTFELGFLNYYLSLGLAFLALAIFWKGAGWKRWFALALAPLVLFSHAVGLALLAGVAAYMALFRVTPSRRRSLLLPAGFSALFALRWFLYHRYVADPDENPLYWYTGADQLALFGFRYWVLAIAFLALTVIFAGFDFWERRRNSSAGSGWVLSLHLYLLSSAGVALLPSGIHVPPFAAALAMLTPRLTLISAVMLCALHGGFLPRKRQFFAYMALALAFFAMLYRDTAKLNTMEARVERLVRTLPPGQRVLGTIQREPGSRVLVQHMLDRACVGHCFSYGNYEPASGAFRVRVDGPNPYVMSNLQSTAEMEEGTYEVQSEDLPAYQVYQCGPVYSSLCIRALQEGEANDQDGFHPQH